MNNSEFIVEKLANNGVDMCFSMVGGHSLFLNKAFSDSKKIRTIYIHNEQSTIMMAEGYFRASKKIAVVNVTSAPAALNTLNGLYGAFVDSIPVIVVSGQPKQSQNTQTTGMPLRQFGDQEFDRIVDVVQPICKYAVKLTESSNIQYELDKCIHYALGGRPGPVWIDVPMDIQGKKFNENEIKFSFSETNINTRLNKPTVNSIDSVISKIKDSKRPLLYLGNQIKPYDYEKYLENFINLLQVPVVTEWNAHDLISTNSSLYAGRPGLRGERAGNFVVHAADLIIFLGSTIPNRQTGQENNAFSPKAFKIMVENDFTEFFKPNLAIDLPVLSNPIIFIKAIMSKLKKDKYSVDANHSKWAAKANSVWKKYRPKYSDYISETRLNPYHFIFDYFRLIPKSINTILGTGMASVGSFHSANIHFGQLLIRNEGCASMGFDIPATIGASLAKPKAKTVCLTGDGSFQLNIQELQTAKGCNLNISFIVINNNGYDSIRQSQKKIFGEDVILHGVSEDSGVTFPNLEKIAYAYAYDYVKIDQDNISDELINTIFEKGQKIIEVFVRDDQYFEPKVGVKKNIDGTISGGLLIDMEPKISKKEINKVINYLLAQD